jgi:y4mF family transcriptional regulator
MKKNKHNDISKFVKAKRKLNKLNQEELAAKAGVGLRFIRDLEQGKTSMRTDKINDVLRLFGSALGVVAMDRQKLLENE